jgi:hypothetical protein
MALPQTWLKSAIETAGGVPVYPKDAPEDAVAPFVIYDRSATTRELVLEDALSATPAAGAVSPVASFSVAIYHTGYLAAWAVADAIRFACHRYAGTSAGVTIESCLLTDESDSDPIYFEGHDAPLYVVSQTYSIRWTE